LYQGTTSKPALSEVEGCRKPLKINGWLQPLRFFRTSCLNTALFP
jgi:hypothetical protein